MAPQHNATERTDGEERRTARRGEHGAQGGQRSRETHGAGFAQGAAEGAVSAASSAAASAREGFSALRERIEGARGADARGAAAAQLPGYENDNIRYMNAGALSRPLDMPAGVRRGLVVALVAAVVIGAVMLFNYFNEVVNAPAREQAALEENLSRDVALNLPPLATYIAMDDASIMAALQATGDTLYEQTPVGTVETGGFRVIKLPEGVSVADAGAMYLTGINKLSAAGAAKLLNGSWDFLVTRDGGANFYVRYADFTSGSIEEAIQNAMTAEGLTTENMEDSGIDDSGNTYATGTIDVGGQTCTWRISVVPLSDMSEYNVQGLPKESVYVGVRYTM